MEHPLAFNRLFLDVNPLMAEDIRLFSDAAKSPNKGFQAFCQDSWMFTKWDTEFMINEDPSIGFLELVGVTAGVLTWIRRFKNKRIYLFCGNMSVVHMINNSSSSCKNCMTLIRLITLEGMLRNVRIYAKHIGTKQNYLSDALSRLQIKKFKELAPATIDSKPTPVPEQIWAIGKIWSQ